MFDKAFSVLNLDGAEPLTAKCLLIATEPSTAYWIGNSVCGAGAAHRLAAQGDRNRRKTPYAEYLKEM